MGWDFKCNLLCLLNLYNKYWNQVHTKLGNLFSISLVSEQKKTLWRLFMDGVQLPQG